MGFWTAAVIIVAIGAVASVLQARYRAQAGIIADKQGNEQFAERSDPEAQREISELRERLKVLERIATSDREAKAISSEIEALRDIKPSHDKAG